MQNYTKITNLINKPAKSNKAFGMLSKVILTVLTIGLSALLVNRYVFQSKATLDPATVTFSPATKTISLNEIVTQTVRINTGEKKVSAVDLVVNFNPTYFEYQPQGEAGHIASTLPANYFTDLVMEKIEPNAPTKLHLVLVSRKPDADLTNNIVVTLRFKAIRESSTARRISLNEPLSMVVGTTGAIESTDHAFDINSTQAIADIIIGGTLTCTADGHCGANASCNASSTCVCNAGSFNCDSSWDNGCEATSACTAAGNVSLNLSVKLQGVNRTPTATNKIKVKLNLTNGSSQQALSDVELVSSSENNGAFVGTVAFNQIVPGPGYTLFVKGPKHVQKRFCTASPTGGVEYRCGANEQIVITEGTNTLNLSAVPLLAGDLPLPQDGVLNSRDVLALKRCINKTDAECLNIGDINYDGAVRASDFSLVIESMGIKYDDEN